MYIYIHTHIYIYVICNIYIYTYVYIYIYICIYIYTYIYIYANRPKNSDAYGMCMCMCMCMCMYVHVHVYVYVYVCMLTFTNRASYVCVAKIQVVKILVVKYVCWLSRTAPARPGNSDAYVYGQPLVQPAPFPAFPAPQGPNLQYSSLYDSAPARSYNVNSGPLPLIYEEPAYGGISSLIVFVLYIYSIYTL